MSDLTPRQRFKVAFLTSCIDAGMSPTQVLGAARAMRAAVELEKSAVTLPDAAANLTGGALAMAAAAPPILGFAGGYLTGKLKDEGTEDDVRSLQKQDLLDAYRRLRLVAEQNKRVKDYENQRRQSGRVFI